MFIPLHDHNPLVHVRRQYVTLTLIGINIVVFAVFQGAAFGALADSTTLSFGLIPAVYSDIRELAPQFAIIPEEFTAITYAFLHGGWMHLIGNMLFLWVFGDNVEDAMGHLRFLIFYILCAVFAGLVHVWASPTSTAPLVGASGAVAGIVAAYLMLHPNVKVWILALGRIPLRIPALWVLGFWILLQFYFLFTDGQSNVAWWAHIGGLVAGAVLVIFLRRPGVPLFDKEAAGR